MNAFCRVLFVCLVLPLFTVSYAAAQEARRPNILIAISDDHSFAHTSFAGYKAVSTPAFDRMAREGVYFQNAFAASPGCSPSRAALLTGRHTWQLEHAGTHDSTFPAKYVVFPDLLEDAGYFVGMTGKGWGPGNFKQDGRSRNPAGPAYQKRKAVPPLTGIRDTDYAANFADFLAEKPDQQPFYFWFGASEPHRDYQQGSGLEAGKKLQDAVPPAFLPDAPEVRSDLLDYCMEIEWFDQHLNRMLQQLEAAGELDHTLVIVTGDNGMPFPRAKANLYEYGIHVPLAMRWGQQIPPGRQIADAVGFVDLSATILEAAQVTFPADRPPLSGRSLLPLLKSKASGQIDPQAVAWSARERHSSSRYQNWTYPQRALRTADYLYIRNFRPERWPAGDPVLLNKDGSSAGPHSGYKDIDACPTLSFLIQHADQPPIQKYLQFAVAHRPAEELFDIRRDPACLTNLASDPNHADVRSKLAAQLENYLRNTEDPRVLDGGDIWETYPRMSAVRSFPKPDEIQK